MQNDNSPQDDNARPPDASQAPPPDASQAPLPDPRAWQRRPRRRRRRQSSLGTWLTLLLVLLVFAAGIFLRFVPPHAPQVTGSARPTPTVAVPTSQTGG